MVGGLLVERAVGKEYFRGAAMTVRVLAFVEGPTEEKFVREIVAPKLHARNIFITATTPGRKRSQGGVQPWNPIRRELFRYLKEDTGRFVTTMFDYY